MGKNLVGFMIGATHYAVDIRRVREVVNPLPLVSVPHCPAHVVGVANHRGRTVPVIDLRVRFGFAPLEPGAPSKWIVADVGGRDVALWVDAVTAVYGADNSKLRPPPDVGSPDASSFLSAVVEHEGSLVFLVDLDRVLSDAYWDVAQEVSISRHERREGKAREDP